MPQSEAPLMGRVAPRANLHSVRLSWVAADIRPIRDSRRRLAASNNRERKKSLRTLQGQFRLPRLSGNHHRVRCSAQMDSRANTCVAPQVDQFISRAGWRTGSASPRRARRQRVAVVRYAQPELSSWDLFDTFATEPDDMGSRLPWYAKPAGASSERLSVTTRVWARFALV